MTGTPWTQTVSVGPMTDLVACYWTVAGPVEIHHGREWSLFDWQRSLRAGRAVGFTGLGLWHADIDHQLETRHARRDGADLPRRRARHIEIEFLQDFFMPDGLARAGRVRPPEEASCSRRRRRSTPTTSRSATFPAAVCEFDQLAEALAARLRRGRRAHRREDRLRDHPVRPEGEHAGVGLELIETRRRTRRTSGSRSTPGTWRSSGSPPERLRDGRRRPDRLGRALRRPLPQPRRLRLRGHVRPPPARRG